MFDAALRRATAPLLAPLAQGLHRAGATAGLVTLTGLAVGIACFCAIAMGAPLLALAFWGGNRVLDGLDGVLARHAGSSSDLGGYLDFLGDVLVYAGIAAALLIVHASAPLPFIVLLALIPVNLTAHLSLAILLEKRAANQDRHQRTLLLVPGIAEGFETIVAFGLMMALPAYAPIVAWAFSAMIVASILQRALVAWRVLGGPTT